MRRHHGGADLTQAERKFFFGERTETWARIHGSPKAKGAHAANKAMGREHDATLQRSDAFTADTAKKTGKSPRTVQRDVQHAKDVVVLKQVVDRGHDANANLADAFTPILRMTHRYIVALHEGAGERLSQIARAPGPRKTASKPRPKRTRDSEFAGSTASRRPPTA